MTAILVTPEVAATLVKNRAEHKKPKATAPVADLGKTSGTSPPRASRRPNRILVDVERELATLVRATRRNIFTMGALLIEAKAKVLHGDWLPWLQKHFGHSARTAENYMNAARYQAKNETVSHLKLSDRALYWLAAIDSDSIDVFWKSRHWPDGIGYQNAGRIVAPLILEIAKTAYVDRKYIDEAVAHQKRKQSAALGAETRAANKAGLAEHGDKWVKREAQSDCWERDGDPGHVMTAEEEKEIEAGKAEVAAREAARIAAMSPTQARKAAMSPEELKAHNTKVSHQGDLKGAVRMLCRLTPNIADLIDVPIETDKLMDAAVVLLAIVAERDEDFGNSMRAIAARAVHADR